MKKIVFIFFSCTLILLPSWVFGQQIATINGQVTDEVGNPLPGANVYIRGTSFGAAADIEGFYSFNAPATGQEVTLTGRYMGYTPKSVTITLSPGTITQNFELNVDVLELEEVVVTGMGGAQIKRKLGISISKVKAELVAKADESNIVQSLAGKAPNVEIVKTSGDPGTSSYIRIRGGASIDRGTQPLFVVDGVPVDNSFNSNAFGGFSGDAASSNVEYSNRAGDINSEDIESIEILKGSAASAIYGSRASNGVVLITTKSGQPGKVKISYKSQIGISEMTRTYPLQRKWGQGSDGKASTTSSISWGPELATLDDMSDAELEAVKLIRGADGNYYYDEKKETLLYYDGKTYDHSHMYSDGGYIIDNNIIISGGNEMTTFFLSAGQYFEKGHWEAGSDYRRTTVRLKGTQVVTEKLKLTGNLAYSNVDAHAIQRADNLSGIGIATLRSPPNFNPKPLFHPETDLHRSYRYQSVSRTQKLKRTRGFDNPYWIMYEQKNPNVVNRVTGYIKAQYDLTNWITLDYHVGSDHITDDRENILPPSTSREGGIGRIMKGLIQTHEIDANFVATIRGDKFLNRWNFIDGTLMLGHNLNSRRKKEFNVGGLDMGVPEGFDQLDNTVQLVADEYRWQRNNESFFGQMTLDLFGQLYITGAVRNDGSSTFGASQKRHWYPKASAAWEFTRFKNIPYVNFGKLRFAYGEAGIRPGVYTTISAYKATSEGFGNFTNATLGANGQYQGKSGFRHSTNLGNNNIEPERTREFEYGLDMSFYNSRIGFELTYYDQRTTDVIFDLNVAPSTGSFSQTKNAATITNKGVELSVNLTPIRHQILSWDMGLIFAANRNKVVDMSGATWEGLGAHAYAMEGQELGIIRQQSWMRFGHGSEYDVDGDDVKENIDEYYAGQWKKEDVWVGEDGKPVMWDGVTYTTPWSSNPRWTGSIRNEFTIFGDITISALVDIVHKRWMDNYGKGQLYKYGTSKDTEVRGQELPINYWLKHGEKAVGPGATNGQGVPFLNDQQWFRTDGGYSGDRYMFIEDAGYIKLREIAVSYRLKGNFIKNLGLSDVTLRLSGRNIYTKTDYTGYDPDTNRSQSTNSRGVDYFNSPQTRVWALTLRVNY